MPVLLMKHLLEPILKRREDLCKHSVRGLKLQGPRAEDAMVEPYFLLEILVI